MQFGWWGGEGCQYLRVVPLMGNMRGMLFEDRKSFGKEFPFGHVGSWVEKIIFYKDYDFFLIKESYNPCP